MFKSKLVMTKNKLKNLNAKHGAIGGLFGQVSDRHEKAKGLTP